MRIRHLAALATFLLSPLSCGRTPSVAPDVSDGSRSDTNSVCEALAYQAQYPVGTFLRSHLACQSDSECGYVDGLACVGGCWQAINASSIPAALETAVEACRVFQDMNCIARASSCSTGNFVPRVACKLGTCTVLNLPGT